MSSVVNFDAYESSVNSTNDAASGSKELGGGALFYPVDPLDLDRFAPIHRELRKFALELGLSDLGAAPVGDARTYELFLERVRAGQCGNLSYLTENPEKRRNPRSAMSDAKTLIVVALSEARLVAETNELRANPFDAPELRSESSEVGGTIVGYATALDYHDVLRQKLKRLASFVKERFPGASTRGTVDTAPILEKDWGRAAGIGFVGLNSLLTSPKLGSRFFLGELLVSIPFETLTGFATTEEYLAARRESLRFDPDAAELACLSCRRCVDACPTTALPGDRTLDARRCLNFWTIENRDEIPPDIAEKLEGRLFGCDICRTVCPRNAKIEAAPPRELPLDAVERLDDATFRRLFKKTPVFRATVDGLKRSARAIEKERERKKSPTTE